MDVKANGRIMKTLFLLFTILCCIVPTTRAASEADSVLICLDRVLSQQDVYRKTKDERIDRLKQLLHRPGITASQAFALNRRLGNEYQLFVSDSAMNYFDRSLALARKLHRTDWVDETQLSRVAVFSVSGMYKEALETLHEVDRSALPDSLLAAWYDCGRQLYSFLAVYSHNQSYTAVYDSLHRQYRDSLIALLPPASPEYRLYKAEQLFASHQYPQARNELSALLRQQPETSNVYARAAFSLAQIYNVEGNRAAYEKYLALSALSDIKASVKENAALQQLAMSLYRQGDIDRAYRYSKYSLEDAIFCNARLRTVEVSNMLPVIDAAYKRQTETQRRQLIFFLVLVSILSAFLIIAVVRIYKQMKRLSATQHNLRQANHIKEEYIGHFLSLCSVYMEKLDHFRRTVHRKVMSGQTEELLKLTKSPQQADGEQKEFYANFDSAFLHLYPDFVARFNELLQPDERFVPKPGELLNTELRIFAFIRLGIDDSSKIANFLHYSVNTIYTYRNKVKNKALNREKFEEEVLKIGSID